MFASARTRLHLIIITALAMTLWVAAAYWAAGYPGLEFGRELRKVPLSVFWPWRMTALVLATGSFVAVHLALSQSGRWTALAAALASVGGCAAGVAAAAAFRYQRWALLQALSRPVMLVDYFLGGGYAQMFGEWADWPVLHHWHIEAYAPVYVLAFIFTLLPGAAAVRWKQSRAARRSSAPN
jgi:hypothetical protein